MTDQTLTDAVREIAEKMHHHASQEHVRRDAERYFRIFAKQLDDLLPPPPPPPRPTLADMTDEERHDAVGMWADVDGFHPYRAVIGDIPAPKVPVFRPAAGSLDWVHPEDVTPLPELGRAWSPGGSPIGTPAPAPALPDGWRFADHWDHGRVIVTNTTPNGGGHVYYVVSDDGDYRGYGWGFCAPDELTYLDQEADQ